MIKLIKFIKKIFLKKNNFRVIVIFLFFSKQISLNSVVFVSLGEGCTVAGVLRHFDLRKNAYPFDWIITNFDSLLSCLDDNFVKFLDPNTLKIGIDKRVVINYYGLQFVHDFPTIYHSAALHDSENHPWATIRDDWREFIYVIGQKYQRRINRLKNILNSKDLVYFVRYPINKEQAVSLRNLLINKYPNLNFIIIAVTRTHEIDWNLTRIKNFQSIEGSPDFWTNWQNIFKSLGFSINEVRDKFSENSIHNHLCFKI